MVGHCLTLAPAVLSSFHCFLVKQPDEGFGNFGRSQKFTSTSRKVVGGHWICKVPVACTCDTFQYVVDTSGKVQAEVEHYGNICITSSHTGKEAFNKE